MRLVRSAEPPRDRARKNTLRFVIGSILIHVVLALVLWTRAPQPPVASDVVSVEYLNPAPPIRPTDQVKRPKTPAATVPRQIVEQEHQLNDEIDPHTRFLSAFNQKVLQETRAAHSGKFNNSVHGGKEASLGRAHEAKPKTAAAKREITPQSGDLSNLGSLLPKYDTPAAVDRVVADAPNGDPTRTDDYLKDLKSGLQTMMSTREFIYYAYYNRIKTALRSHWEPEVRERVNIILRQGRQLASAHDRVTQVVVTLDARGELLGVTVLSQSGFADLDNAAVEAFRQAAPFPNPPRGMVEVDGTVKIRWDFVLEV